MPDKFIDLSHRVQVHDGPTLILAKQAPDDICSSVMKDDASRRWHSIAEFSLMSAICGGLGKALLLAGALGLSSWSALSAEWGQWSPYPASPGLYQEKCGRCHPDAGRFAPERLELVEATLRSKVSGKALGDLLRRHPVRLSEAELASLIDAMTVIVTEGGQFHQRCAVCHDSASALAKRLILRDDRLFGRYSGHDIEVYLEGHGRLDPEGAAFFAALLRRFAAAEGEP